MKANIILYRQYIKPLDLKASETASNIVDIIPFEYSDIMELVEKLAELHQVYILSSWSASSKNRGEKNGV